MRFATIRTDQGTTAARGDVQPRGGGGGGGGEVGRALIIAQPVYRASAEQAAAAIAGYTVINDVSMRDWQRRTLQWLQGKVFEHSPPARPYLVTPAEVGNAAAP